MFVVFLYPLFPEKAHAGVRSFVSGFFTAEAKDLDIDLRHENSQNMPVAQAVANISPSDSSHEIVIVDESAIETTSGPVGTVLEIDEKEIADKISIYYVRDGDTISGIAQMFKVSPNTVMWANDLRSAKDLRKGMELVILPISGVKHVVAKGETLASIAKKFGGDTDEIIRFNDLGENPKLVVGAEILIPNGEIPTETKVKTTVATAKANTAGNKAYGGYFVKPTTGTKTQGLHGKFKTGVDIGNKPGTAVYAAASGKVIISRTGGWNGGYGNYIVIQHPNGLQTVYAHLQETVVATGTTVKQGQLIGKMGSTGKSTGTHLHFEILGGVKNWNPF